MAIRSSWKLSRIRSSWASALSSNLSHYATAPPVTSTRLWPHSRHHLWRCNFQASSHGSFWSPNVRTQRKNGLEVLPHCIVCTEQRVLVNLIYLPLPNLFADIYILPRCGKISCSPEVLRLRFTFHSLVDVSPIRSKPGFTRFCQFPAGSPSNPFPIALSDVSSFARWLLLLLPRQFRFKNRFFFNFFTMYTMRIFYYIEQWPYSRQHSFPTLNQHLYPVQMYGTNLMDFDHTILTRPMPSLTQSTSLRLILLRKKPLWMTCWNLIFQNHINTWLLLHLMPFQIRRSSQPPHRHLPNANRTPKLLLKHLQNVAVVLNNRDPVPRARCRHGLLKTSKNFAL